MRKKKQTTPNGLLANLQICWWTNKHPDGKSGFDKNKRVNPRTDELERVIEFLKTDKGLETRTKEWRQLKSNPKFFAKKFNSRNKWREAEGLKPVTEDEFRRKFKTDYANIYFSVSKFTKGLTKSDVETHTGLFCYDIENLANGLHERLIRDPHTVVVGKSLSGEENYWLILYNPNATTELHKNYWLAGEKYLCETYGLPQAGETNSVGKSDKVYDVTRIRAAAFDPEIYFNPTPTPFLYVPMNGNVDPTDFFNSYINAPSGGGNEVLQRLAYTFGGLVSAGRIAGFDEAKGQEFLENEISKRTKGEPDLNAGLHQYKEGLKKPLTDQNAKGVLIPVNEDLFWNSLTHMMCKKVEDRFVNVDNKDLHELWKQDCYDDGRGKYRIGFDSWYHAQVANAKRISPWEEFFQTPWSGVDHFKILAKYVECEDPEWINDLRKHMIRGINMVMQGTPIRLINRVGFILQSELTNIGKSTLLRQITLSDKVNSFGGEIDITQTNLEIKKLLCQMFNVIMEEIEQLTQKELGNVKAIISLPGMTARLTHDKQPTELKRMATIWGSVNQKGFLNSTDHRWNVHTIKKIDWEYTKEVEFVELWRQAYKEWELNPASGELKEEWGRIEKNAENHLALNPIDEIINKMVVGDMNAVPLLTSEIAEHIDIQRKTDRSFTTQVGYGMKKLFKKFMYSGNSYKGEDGILKRGTLYRVMLLAFDGRPMIFKPRKPPTGQQVKKKKKNKVEVDGS